MRLDFLQKLPTWPTFGKGWGRRVEEVEKIAAHMAEG
jgi:lysozyme family protein